ncbi:GTP pyrophosphokinase [Elstera cyanobacteriorum]|uniref:GTP pyrophosphokinase rsh n=1 Tax=Elstera cyanobacteriorum TaxID=2022747 RepID=A0A255XN95_9PROT|nr:bifunctional (p)ppGpp synthetase/guanosine-3',5'-bis(diphosphate) 3'-pyrophosphohydrolase [Elstera cyanobacteriorum]OYQ18453.1 bifunctional (p)ppGpp synthetase/guanosine-3',5'-bis(diphosphate) 3'-pyrophosphohydrolase [Elstera cyanobacteriorum]GFZ80170.1 GTP pyrophosphokinase [Elstera cyanobacteriorum]
MIRQYELVDLVRAYDPDVDEDILNRAYVFALKAHGAQKRANGDPYFSHPLEVAGILTGLRLDTASIVTALLHDVIEDTEVKLPDIEKAFGKEIGRLVNGVTKLTRIELQSDQTKQAENFRKFVLAMSEDIRVLLVKLADRLHNMRTLNFIPKPEKRSRIAAETLEIYAPLADRIGMQKIKDELEDLAFAQLNTEARDSIVKRLEYLRGGGQDLIQKIIAELQAKLTESGIQAKVKGREKAPYSIWRKMQHKNIAFEQLSDIIAFRVVVPSAEKCYEALGVLHALYPSVPGRFKDYISTPKPNGYRSIHTGVIGPQRQRIEVQIRTDAMDEVAEYGVAAHWHYKRQGGSDQVLEGADQGAGSIIPAPTLGSGKKSEGAQYRWLRELLDILEHASGPEEFLEHTKLEMFQDQVFCFTPKGELFQLPRGATPVDFAYAVHSQIGDTCVGAKINGRIVQLRSVLQNGDQVEIITSKGQTPSADWEDFVVTGKAKARIRRYVRIQRRAQYMTLGRTVIEKEFRHEGYAFTEKALDGVLKTLQAPTIDDLYAMVGEGLVTGREVIHTVFPGTKPSVKNPASPIVKPKRKEGGGVPLRGLIPGMAVHYARCCHPLPGDRIVGIVTTGKGVTVHTIDCVNLESFADTPERWIDVAWETDAALPEHHIGRLHMIATNEPGTIGTLGTVIGKNQGNITNLKFVTRSTDFFELLVDVEVTDVRHLTNIIAALRATPSINSVDRARG